MRVPEVLDRAHHQSTLREVVALNAVASRLIPLPVLAPNKLGHRWVYLPP